MTTAPARLPVVIVTGLSGSGKASALRALEDIGYEAVDNPPLHMLEDMVTRSDRGLAVGIDARTRGFDAAAVLNALGRLQRNPALHVQLAYAWATEPTLLRRYTESRRRHPLAPQGRVPDGIAAEIALTAPLREQADLVIDTSDLPVAQLRRLIEQRFGDASSGQTSLMVLLMSFAYPKGLPPEADLVFDARFLRNPHYDPILRDRTGLDPEVGAYVEQDPDFQKFFASVRDLVDLVLPRFVQEGKKYATITIGCTGGKHRSVHLIEKLANHLTQLAAAQHDGTSSTPPWKVAVTHRELTRNSAPGAAPPDRPVAQPSGLDLHNVARALSVQAQEA
jgi:UPF0042 nucleotide-binding protein